MLFRSLLLTLSRASVSDIHKLDTQEELFNFTIQENTTTLYLVIDTKDFGVNAELLLSINYPTVNSIEGQLYSEENIENIKTETSFKHKVYFQLEDNYLLPFKSSALNTRTFFCVKVTFTPTGNNSTLTAVFTHSQGEYIEKSNNTSFTCEKGVPKMFIYYFNKNDDERGLLFSSPKEQMNLFTEDLFSNTIPPVIKTNIYGYYREVTTGFNIFIIVFISKGETIEFNVNLNDKISETSYTEYKEDEVIQSIEVKNAYEPLYFIETFAHEGENHFVHLNLRNKAHTRVYHKNNLEVTNGTVLDEGFALVESQFVASTTKYDIFKIECDVRCELEITYINADDITEKTLKVNEMFMTVVKAGNPLMYTYSNVQYNDKYEFIVMNNKEVSITLGESTPLMLNAETNVASGVVSGIGDEGTLTITIETANEDGEVFVQGKIVRNSLFRFEQLTDENNIIITPQVDETESDIVVEIPQKEYDSMHVEVSPSDYFLSINVSYALYAGDKDFVHVPFKKPNELAQAYNPHLFDIYNPYYLVDDTKYYLVIHLSSDATLKYEILIQLMETTTKGVITSNQETVLTESGVYRLNKPTENASNILIIFSKCLTSSTRANLTLQNYGTNLKLMPSKNLTSHYVYEHKNYTFDLDIAIDPNNTIYFYYTFTNETEGDLNFSGDTALKVEQETTETVNFKWKTPLWNSNRTFEYSIYLIEDHSVYGEGIDICSIITSTPNETLNSKDNTFIKTMTVNQTDVSYLGVVVAREPNGFNTNFIYTPSKFIVADGDVLLLVLIIVIVLLIVAIVSVVVKGKRKYNDIELLPEKDKPLD